MNKLISLGAAVTLALAATSCSDDDKGFSAETQIYQDYLVQIKSNGLNNATTTSINAYATFRNTYSQGSVLTLPDGAYLNINSLSSMELSDEVYNYAVQLPLKSSAATFLFKKSDKQSFTNRIEFNNCPKLSVESIPSTLKNNEYYKFNVVDGELNSDISIDVILFTGKTEITEYKASVFPSGTFMFNGVPAGQYTLCTSITYTAPLQESDGNAGGKMSVNRIDYHTQPVNIE